MIAFLQRHRFKILLANLAALLVVSPLVLEDVVSVTKEFGRGVVVAIGLCLLLTASLAAGGRHGTKLLIIAILVPSLLLELAVTSLQFSRIALLNHVLRILFIATIVVQLLRNLFSPQRVTFDTLCASLCVYLLMGLFWMNVYIITETLNPGSYRTTIRMSNDPPGLIGEAERSIRMLYFSFTTLTSVGYGDIIPANNAARMLAVMEALVGQSFMLIIVSRLVGLQISQEISGDAEKK